MQRITRKRVSYDAGYGRIRRTRPVKIPQVKPYFLVDYNLPWGSLFQLYLMASFLYYHQNRSVLTNDEYDKLCGVLLNGWHKAKHPHKHLVTRSDLRAVTGFKITYPLIVQHAALRLLDTYSERK